MADNDDSQKIEQKVESINDPENDPSKESNENKENEKPELNDNNNNEESLKKEENNNSEENNKIDDDKKEESDIKEMPEEKKEEENKNEEEGDVINNDSKNINNVRKPIEMQEMQEMKEMSEIKDENNNSSDNQETGIVIKDIENKDKNENEEKKVNDDDEDKDNEKKDDEDDEDNKEEEKQEEEKTHERSELSLEGAIKPISIYTRRVMDISKIGDYLHPNSSRGQVGGRNLGNTCFMNSSIACLSNTTELTYYFLKGDYLKDINEENRLGMRGELAREWGKLLQEYWVENTRVGDPSDFKSTIGRKAERFRGYGQQDSNEFMSVFLDYLNEDLNRVSKKEYIEMKERGENETDEECAKRFWECNLKRNDSIVTDLFCGQFKSTITCPDCGWINITFDPFDTINLPLLTHKKNSYGGDNKIEEFKFFYIPKNLFRQPMCLLVKNINSSELVCSLIDRIKKEKDFYYHDKIDDLFLVDMLRKDKYGYAEKTQSVRYFNYDHEFLFSFDFDKKKDEFAFPVYCYKNKERDTKSEYPRMVFCKRDDTLDVVKKKIYFYLRKYILSPLLKDNEEKDEVTLEIEKYLKDENHELPDEKIYELVENEYNEVFKVYDTDNDDKDKDEKKEEKDDDDDEKKDDDDNEKKDEEEKNEEKLDNEEEKNEENKNQENQEEEKTEEEKKEEEKNEEEKNGEEEKNEENKEKEEKKEDNKNEEAKNNENEDKEKEKEEKNEKNKEDKSSPKPEEESKKLIEKFKSDIPFQIFIRKEKDDNYYRGKYTFFSSKYFSTYNKSLKKFLEIDDFSSPLHEIQIDMNNYEIVVEFNEDSKYINKDTFDLDHFEQTSFEYEIKKEEPKKEKEEEDEDDGKMTLEKCLKKFCKEEQLEAGDEWYCSKCKKHVLAKKKLDLYYLPKILIICFKRFIKDSYRWEKNDDEVDFPIHDMDMKNFVIGPDKDHSKYDLFAVSQHYGSTGFGHYTAVCKNDGKWYSYNDSSCSVTTESDALSSAAYVLFYRRQTD